MEQEKIPQQKKRHKHTLTLTRAHDHSAHVDTICIHTCVLQYKKHVIGARGVLELRLWDREPCPPLAQIDTACSRARAPRPRASFGVKKVHELGSCAL